MLDESPRRSLPSVDALLRALRDEAPSMPRPLALTSARAALARARAAMETATTGPSFQEVLDDAIRLAAQWTGGSLQPVINASGVILHTNLGRAPLSPRARTAMDEVARGYSNLEFDLGTGSRGSRHVHLRSLITEVTGAEDVLVVNNNAAALLMALQVFAAQREVIVSRGQAVEIGGGFRIPDVIAQSGATIVEVGTTNRTYIDDYARAAGPATAAILRVHASNFRITGFTHQPAIEGLAALAHERGLLLIDDLGSGAVIPTERFGLPHEPMVQESVSAGAGLVLFSGDKLLGGPQCGVIAGKAALIERLRSHPLARALRVDKLTIAALSATLIAYVSGAEDEEIPVWRMLAQPEESLHRRASDWVAAAGTGDVIPGRSVVGGGSLPDESVPTWLSAIPSRDAEGLRDALRAWTPPIIARVEHDRVLLDPRTVLPEQDLVISAALADVLRPA